MQSIARLILILPLALLLCACAAFAENRAAAAYNEPRAWSAGIFVGSPFFVGFRDWPHRHFIVVHRHLHVPRLHKHHHHIGRHAPHHHHGLKHRRALRDKLFAPPHVRLHPDARRHLGQTGRRLHIRPDTSPRGIPRLGPRHDRLTTWPGFSGQQRFFVAPRFKSH